MSMTDHKIIGRDVPLTINRKGEYCWEGMHTPESDKRRLIACLPPDMPGIVIFVHGVNSEGEWYERGENFLLGGLNTRLKRKDIEPFRRNDEKRRQIPDPPHTRTRSPIIDFFWGYRAPDGESKQWLIPLRGKNDASAWSKTEYASPPHYWGGGPFQNGTNNLALMWSETGFRRRVWAGPIPYDIQRLNPEVDRQLQDAPSRTYYVHAAQRLAKLIDLIRTTYPDDTISVISHSQGTMVAMSAMFMVKTRVPDCLMLANSPYAMESKVTDSLQLGNDALTERARQETFINLLKKFQAGKRSLSEAQMQDLRVGLQSEGVKWRPGQEGERENHGRVYVYFSPHDRVMGSTALQSIGWKGAPKNMLEQFKGTLYQRMLARNTACGATPGDQALWPQDGRPFWDGNRKTRGLIKADLWATPDKNHTVHINTETVPNPIRPEEMANFDVARNSNTEDSTWKKQDDYKFFKDIYQPERYVQDGEDADGQAYYRMENQAEMEQRIGNYVVEPTDHSDLPGHEAFLSRVVAYDLPVGPCDSFNDAAFWKELKQLADWTSGKDEYFNTGKLSVPPMPPEIVKETFGELQQQDAALQKYQQQETRLAQHKTTPRG